MLKLNRAQREALKEVYDRGPIFKKTYGVVSMSEMTESWSARDHLPRMTYREFRATVTPLLGGGGCVMVPWSFQTSPVSINSWNPTMVSSSVTSPDSNAILKC